MQFCNGKLLAAVQNTPWAVHELDRRENTAQVGLMQLHDESLLADASLSRLPDQLLWYQRDNHGLREAQQLEPRRKTMRHARGHSRHCR